MELEMKIDEATALAILVTNLKRRKRVNSPLEIAESAKFLTEFYASQYNVADAVGVHESVIRKWARLAGAPDELKQYVEAEKIHPVAAFAIISAFPDAEQQLEIARVVAGWGERDITRLVRLRKRNPDFSIGECKQKIIKDR
jgi:hypothetical protein